MSINTANTKKASLLALLQVLIIVAMIVVAKLSKGDLALYGTISMLLVLILGLLTIAGTFYSIKSFNESNSFIKTIAMMINFGMFLLFLWAIISNILDVFKSIN